MGGEGLIPEVMGAGMSPLRAGTCGKGPSFSASATVVPAEQGNRKKTALGGWGHGGVITPVYLIHRVIFNVCCVLLFNMSVLSVVKLER